jgi:hypothetical protein
MSRVRADAVSSVARASEASGMTDKDQSARGPAVERLTKLLFDYLDSEGGFYTEENCPPGFTPGDPLNDADEAAFLANAILDELLVTRPALAVLREDDDPDDDDDVSGYSRADLLFGGNW